MGMNGLADCEKLVSNDLTVHGLRRLHVMASGRIDVGRWLEMTPGDARHLAKAHQHEDELGAWHLWLVWNARERVTFETVGSNGERVRLVGVLWYVDKGETLSWAGEMAARRYELDMGRKATHLFVRGPLRMGPTGASGIAGMQIVECGWMPKRYVAVAEGSMDGGEHG